MNILSFILLALAPGVFWLWFFARRDVYQPEPLRLIALTFFLGMVSTVPALLLEALFLGNSSATGGILDPTSLAVTMLFVVGPVEETVKFASVRLGPFRTRYFDEPADGLVYSAAASLGFASVENLGYILTFGPAVMLVRAPLSTLAHVVFGSIWGYALGAQAQPRPGGALMVLAALSVAAAVHGLFNVGVFSYPVLSLLLLAIGVSWTLGRFRWAQRVSPFRFWRDTPRVECQQCHRLFLVTRRFCRFCGSPTPPEERGDLFCGHCGTRNAPDASQCAACGNKFSLPPSDR